MPLTTDEYQVVKKWLETNPIAIKCPLCLESAKWETGELVGLPLKSKDAYKFDDRGFHVINVPVVQLICAACGYTAHFAAKKVGLR